MKQVLENLNIDYLYNSSKPDLKGTSYLLRFDYIINTKCGRQFMIELNGIQHYEPSRFGGMTLEVAEECFRKQIHHDSLKLKYCQKNGYPLLSIRYDDTRNYDTILQDFVNENGLTL
jgi:hypothetical protein